MSKKKNLLVIGDLTLDGARPAPCLNRFLGYANVLKRRGVNCEFAAYDALSIGRLPKFSGNDIKALFFFPYDYWNMRIERYDKDRRIYGDVNFGREYKLFLEGAERTLQRAYKDKTLEYINPPRSCYLDRDKRGAALSLNKQGILTPDVYQPKDLGQFYHLLEQGRAIYIKPPFGSMGKGITYVDKRQCWTNFIFRDKIIFSRTYDYNWGFVRISPRQRDAFISALIANKFVFERALRPLSVKGRKVDLRGYCVYGDVPYIYARSAPVNSFITNWSQGGRIEKNGFLVRLLGRRRMGVISDLCRRVSKALGINYAGIDILPDGDGERNYILEAHSFPGYERGFDLMRFLANRI